MSEPNFRRPGAVVQQITTGGKLATFLRAEITDDRFANPYCEWRDAFDRTNPGRAAIDALRKLKNRNLAPFEVFTDAVMFACWCALQYREQPRKQHVLALERQAAEQRHLKMVIDAAKALLELVKSRDAPPWMTEDPLPALADQPLAVWIADLEAMEKSSGLLGDLESEKPSRTEIACLGYNRRVFGRRRPAGEATELGLAYDLARRFRCWTDTACADPLGADVVRIDPEVGSPHYDIVATLVVAALKGERNRSLESRSLEADRIENLVRQFRSDYPKARYIGWYLAAAAFPTCNSGQ